MERGLHVVFQHEAASRYIPNQHRSSPISTVGHVQPRDVNNADLWSIEPDGIGIDMALIVSTRSG